MRRRVLVRSLLLAGGIGTVVSAGVIFALATRSSAAGPTCTDSWIGGNGLWSTAANWSTNAVPGPTDDVCIGPGGPATSYQVVFQGSASVDALTVGGAPGTTGATQTLLIAGGSFNGAADLGDANLTFTSTTLASQTLAGGVVDLDSQDGNGHSLLATGTGAPNFVNAGVLRTSQTSTNTRFIRLNLTNTGTIDIAGSDSQLDNGNTITNNGSMTVDATGVMSLSNNSVVSDQGGTLVNNGRFGLNGATFIQGGGATSGTPIHLQGSSTLSFTGPGAGAWDLQGSATLTGDMAPGQTVRVLGGTDAPFGNLGDANVTADGDHVWGGTMILDSLNGAGHALITGTGTKTIPAAGLFKTLATGINTRFIRLNITNNGTVDLAATTQVDNGNTITNNGTFTVEPSGFLSLANNSVFSDQGGTLVNNGMFGLNGATFIQGGGAMSGIPIHLQGGSTLSFTGTGAGAWDLQGSATLTGDMAPGQTVRVLGGTDAPFGNLGDANVTADGDHIWGGTISLDSLDSNGHALITGTGTKTIPTAGVFKTLATGGNTRFIRLNITNNGTIDIAGADTQLDNGNTLINNASMTVDATGVLTVANASVVSDQGGTLVNNGMFGLNGATFIQGGGATSGTPIHLQGGSTLSFTGAGAGAWDLQGSATLTGDMAPGQTVRVLGGTDAPFGNLGDANVTADGDHVWGGTIILDSLDGNGHALITGTGTKTIPAGGVLRTAQTGGNSRFLRLNITNNGTIDIAGTTQFDTGNTMTNNASMTVAATGFLSLANNSVVSDQGGTLVNNGMFGLNGATFIQGGGATSGTPIHLQGGSTLSFTGAGAGAWDLQGSATLTGDMAPGQTVRVLGGTDGPFGNLGDANVTADGDHTWGGTIILDSLDGNGHALITGTGTKTIPAGGVLRTAQTGGNSRFLRLNITNNGTIDIAGTTQFDTGNTLINNGTLNLEASVLTVSGGSVLTLGSAGKLVTTVNDPIVGQINGNGGTVTAAGELDVTTINAVVAHRYPFIINTTFSGVFASHQFGSTHYKILYSSSGATLILDTTPPAVVISSGPPSNTTLTTATFDFTATDPDDAPATLTFTCAVDSGAPVACTSPESYSGVAAGSHTFTVVATDPAGNTGSAAYPWTVQSTTTTTTTTTTLPPVTTTTAAPPPTKPTAPAPTATAPPAPTTTAPTTTAPTTTAAPGPATTAAPGPATTAAPGPATTAAPGPATTAAPGPTTPPSPSSPSSPSPSPAGQQLAAAAATTTTTTIAPPPVTTFAPPPAPPPGGQDIALGSPSGDPGQTVTVSGHGCPAGSTVTLTLEDTNVGTTTALEDGSFSSSIALPLVSIGVHDVVATCADVTIHTPITVVLSTSAPESGETALGAVLGFFVLLALAFILIRPQSGVTLGALPGRAVDD